MIFSHFGNNERVFAQNYLNVPQSADLLSVTMIPSVPAPGDNISVELRSYATNLDKADISWTINGEPVLKGKGEKHFELSAGKAGEKTALKITIRTSEGETLVRDINIIPGNIDLLWEASTYTPPFYKGKALFTPQAELRVLAVPNIISANGKLIGSDDLIYRWKVNGKFIDKESGYNKNLLIVSGSSVQQETRIEVEAESLSGGAKAKGIIYVPESVPEIIVYEDNPLVGIFYEQSIPNSFTLAAKEVRLAAVPFFFSTGKKESGITYEWSVNGEKTDNDVSSIVLRNDRTSGESVETALGEQSRQAEIKLLVKNNSKKFQFMRKTLFMSY